MAIVVMALPLSEADLLTDTRDYELMVSSAHGNPDPGVGVNTYAWHSTVTCTVDSVVDAGLVTYLCAGWTGTGDVPGSGGTTNTGGVVLSNLSSSVTWNWSARSNADPGWAEVELSTDTRDYELVVTSAHGNPDPCRGNERVRVACDGDRSRRGGGHGGRDQLLFPGVERNGQRAAIRYDHQHGRVRADQPDVRDRVAVGAGRLG